MSLSNTNMNDEFGLVHWLENKFTQLTCLKTDIPAYILLESDGNNEGENKVALNHLDLLIQAKCLAAHLQAECKPGERAILLYPFGLEYIVAFFACLYAGIIAVPAFPPNTRKRDWGRIDAIFDNASPALILTTSSLETSITQWLDDRQSRPSSSVILSDTVKATNSSSWLQPPSDSETIAFLQYSSGSTGTPKGVMVSHGNILHNLSVIADGFSLNACDKGVSWLPIYHDMGLIGSILEPFSLGITVYLMSPIDVLQKPIRWLKAISDYKLTASGGPNFIYEHCINRIKDDDLKGINLGSWKLAFNGAEPIHKNTLSRFIEKFSPYDFTPESLTPCYGMAETTLMVSSCTRGQTFSVLEKADGNQQTTLVSSGRVHTDLDVKIVNPETRIECLDGQTGEIWVKGRSVAKGYWQQADLTQEMFNAEIIGNKGTRFLRTGDLGIKKNQELFVTGRIKELIIVRGQNHYPQDIESTVANCCDELATSPGASFSVTIEDTERLVVVHEINRQYLRKFDGSHVVQKVRQAIAENHQIQLYSLVLIKPASLLRTTSGKIRRVSMRELFLQNNLENVYAFTQQSLKPSPTTKGVPQSDVTETLCWLRTYAETRINSRLIDERRSIPPYIVLDFGNKGLMGLHVEKTDGGSGYSYQQAMEIYQQLGAIDPSLSLFVGLGNVLGLRPIQNFASERIKNSYLTDLAKGRVLAAFAISEPGAGSNPLALTTTAVEDEHGNYIVNGTKVWSGTAAWASVIHVFAKTYDANGNALGITGFAVEQGIDGLFIGPEALTMGMRGTCQSRVELRDVTIKPDAILGEIGGGMLVAQDAMKFGRLVITAAAIGGMKRCAQLMIRYAQRRQISTGSLIDNPVTLERIQELTHGITAVENLVKIIAQCLDDGIDVPIELYAACKITGPEFFWQGADNLVQLLGGRGYIENNIAPQLLRDARILRIFEGPTETLSMFLGAKYLKSSNDLNRFITKTLSDSIEIENLSNCIKTLREFAKNSQVFDKSINVERWTHERVGWLLSLTLLKISVKDSNLKTTAWIDQQITSEVNRAQCFLDNSGSLKRLDLLAAVESYESQIGNIEQQSSNEDRDLDEFLQRDTDVNSSFVNYVPHPNPITIKNRQTFESNNNTAPEQRKSSETIEISKRKEIIRQLNSWMQTWIADRLELPKTDINVDHDFASFGLDSVDAIELTSGLSSEFGIEVKADFAWIYPSIDQASDYLCAQIEANESTDTSEKVEEKWLEGEI